MVDLGECVHGSDGSHLDELVNALAEAPGQDS
jgi:hypothetical protein